MNPVAIQYIWQAIRDSERSDDLSFIDALTRLTQPPPDQPGVTSRALITTAAAELRPTATLPRLAQP